MEVNLLVAIPKEIIDGENRVAITPEITSKLTQNGIDVTIETNAGINAGFLDQDYITAGAKIIKEKSELLASADIILKIQKPVFDKNYGKNEIDMLKPNSLLISLNYILSYPDIAKLAAEKKINLLSLDLIPRITLAQSMDVLSSQSNIAGYKAVLLCANELNKLFPLMMTAAGTITPAKVVVLGAGVAGLQAIATAKRLGAIVEVSDVRPQVKQEVESLGAKFIEVPTEENLQDEGGYAKEQSEEFLKKQKELLFKKITEADVVITTALIPGKKAPILVTEEMVKNMKKGSVILDMATEFGGNCEISEMDKIINKYGVKIIGYKNLPSLVPKVSSELFARNIHSLLKYLLGKENKLNLDINDQILSSALVTLDGKIVNTRIKSLLNME